MLSLVATRDEYTFQIFECEILYDRSGCVLNVLHQLRLSAHSRRKLTRTDCTGDHSPVSLIHRGCYFPQIAEIGIACDYAFALPAYTTTLAAECALLRSFPENLQTVDQSHAFFFKIFNAAQEAAI